MSLGHRVFVIENATLSRISQKSFNDFYVREKPSLPQYANRIILVVTVIYILENKKPYEVLRLDPMKVKVLQDGSIDQEYKDERTWLSMRKFGENMIPSKGQPDEGLISHDRNNDNATTVVNASRRFEERKWEQLHPKLPYPVLKEIYEGIFE